MSNVFRMNRIMCIFIMLALAVSWVGIACAATNNTGWGKPRGMDIYIGDIPYSASLSGAVKSGEKGVGDFNVIVDDDKPGKEDPSWFTGLGTTPTPTETPTMAPTATTTVVIPIDEEGVGEQMCAADATSDVIVDFAYSSAWYKNEFKLSSPKSVSLGWSQGEMPSGRTGTAFGTTWNLGKFAPGQELIFTDKANGVTYSTGPASRNPDNVTHSAVSLKNTTGTYHKYLVTFEDSEGGGDKDYNDLEFYVSGNVSIDCTTTEDPGDSGGGAVIPVYVQGSVCKCQSPKYDSKGKATCVAQFTYINNNTAGHSYYIPVRERSLPWNEFTGSGMVEQYRCQPTTFYAIASTNSPFWTNRFWNNIKWKLGYEQSVLVKCETNTPLCTNSDAVCTECMRNESAR